MKKADIVTKILIYNIEECDNNTKNLIEQAQAATKRAYVPYSHYHVGAALLLTDGTIVTGNNQENASYPAGICAERTALFYAGSQYPNAVVEAIAIAAYYNDEYPENVCTPCGICRQALVEYENKNEHNIRVIMCGRNEVYEVKSAKDLLPLSFGADALA